MKHSATMGQVIAGLLAVACPILSVCSAEDAGFVLHCGRYRPEWATEGCPPPPGWEEAHSHFLLADDPGELEQPREDWTEKVERRDALLKDIEAREGLSSAWDGAVLDAASWHYPKGGDLEAARLYFARKKEWMMRMSGSPAWRHDPAHLDAVADFLGEIGEWRFPIGMLWFEDRPGQDVLRRAGVESPDDLPDETQRAAYRKAVDEDARRHILYALQQTLFSEGNSLLDVAWEHCRQALRAAEKAGDAEAVRRLKAVKRKIFASTDDPEALLRDTLADDNSEFVGFAHSGPIDLRNPPPYYKLTPEEEEVRRHFLLADDPGELEQPREDWTEKVEQRDALLKEIETREGFSAAWDEAFLDAAFWHYPKGGGLEAAQLYFRKKTEWMLRMLVSPEWFHDPVHLDAAAEFLGEIREWNFPAWVIVYPDQPGRDILERAGVESPDDLPGDDLRAAYRKAVEDCDRMIALDHLHKVLFHADMVTRFGWWHCKQGLLIAEKNGDTEAVRRLEAVKKKIFANTAYPEALLRSTLADEPDCEEAIGAAPPPVWAR